AAELKGKCNDKVAADVRRWIQMAVLSASLRRRLRRFGCVVFDDVMKIITVSALDSHSLNGESITTKMNIETNAQLLKALNWRYATKVFDATKKIPTDTWAALEQSLVLTPTSYGLQPYRFLIVQNPEVRAALLLQSWNQKQVVNCSHYVVFLARTD